MGSKVGSPAAGAFDVVVMGFIEPHSKAFLSGSLSRVVGDTIVHRDAPSRDRPDISWKGRSVSRYFHPRSETTTPSSSLC
jgi:hypothetical protein